MVGLNDIPGANDYGPLDHVLELPNVARPPMPLQRAYGILGESKILPAFALSMPLDEVMRKNGNVALALAQRWKFKARNV